MNDARYSNSRTTYYLIILILIKKLLDLLIYIDIPEWHVHNKRITVPLLLLSLIA